MLVVGHGVVRTSSSLFIGEGGRRLLLSWVHHQARLNASGGGYFSSNSDEQFAQKRMQILTQGALAFSAWNHTAQPCRALVEALLLSDGEDGGRGLGVLDAEALESCIHWREVGLGIITSLNLTSMGSSAHARQKGGSASEVDCCSHVFMSLQDFASVMVKNKHAALQLLENAPAVLELLFKGTRLYESLVELYDSLRQNAVMYYLESLWQNVAELNGNASNGTSSWEGSFASANRTQIQMMRRFLRNHKLQVALFHAYASESFAVQNFDSSVVGEDRQQGASANSVHGAAEYGDKDQGTGSGRRLLQNRDGGVVDSYSSLVASTKGFSNIAVSSMGSLRGSASIPLVTDTWLEGPFGWPPR
jgi:hypothetical protein